MTSLITWSDDFSNWKTLPKEESFILVRFKDGSVYPATYAGNFQVYEDGEYDCEGFPEPENLNKKQIALIPCFDTYFTGSLGAITNEVCLTKEGVDLLSSLRGLAPEIIEADFITNWAEIPTFKETTGGKK